MDEQLKENLKYLGLTRMARVFDDLAARAAARSLQPADFAAELVEAEVAARRERAIARRVRQACFPVVKTIDDFDWSEAPFINRRQIEYFFRLDFVGRRQNIAFIGSPGTGKSHLATALGYQACVHGHSVLFAQAVDIIGELAEAQAEGRYSQAIRRFSAPEILIIDEIGYLATDAHGADLFFQVISERYETGSVIVTSNLAFPEWVGVFAGNKALTGAILDRLCHNCFTVLMEGPSFRMRHRGTMPPPK